MLNSFNLLNKGCSDLTIVTEVNAVFSLLYVETSEESLTKFSPNNVDNGSTTLSCVLAIITAVPILIILIGIVVWISRKRKK